ILLVSVGFILLIKGADFLVNGASSFAKRFHISDLAIGLTVVAMGTSAPELVVNIISGAEGTLDDVVFGNIIGSNIFNLFLILGIASVIYPLTVESNALWKEIPYSFFVTIIFFLLVNDVWIHGRDFEDNVNLSDTAVSFESPNIMYDNSDGLGKFESQNFVQIEGTFDSNNDGVGDNDGFFELDSVLAGRITFINPNQEPIIVTQDMNSSVTITSVRGDTLDFKDAIILFVMFAIFLTYIFMNLKRHPEEIDGEDIVIFSSSKTAIMVVLGIAGLVFGGQMIIDNAVKLAEGWGMSRKLIGLTILAAGTSLPELATSAVAAFQKKSDLAVGNIIGSNVFNLLLVIGSTVLVNGPLTFNSALNVDIGFVGLGTVLLFIFMFTLNKYKLDRSEGFVYLMFFVLYNCYIFNVFGGRG
ncbi:MAG: calcium/sodium antiporter, partial [Cytophagales bacterium]|nr:calcium/sodium antiporter [Cytophagales bacterium]